MGGVQKGQNIDYVIFERSPRNEQDCKKLQYRAGRDNLYTPFSGPYLSGVLFMSFKLGGAYLLYFSYHGCLP